MGVSGLWPLLDSTGKPVDLSKLEGKRLAVDISLWLCQAESGYAAHGVPSKSPHLSLLLHRISKLLYYKVRPIFVFDGEIPPFKRQLVRERALKRHLDELQLNKRQKLLLTKLAQSNLDKSQSPDKKRLLESEITNKFTKSNNSEDLFELPKPSTSIGSQVIEEDVKVEEEDSQDYLAGYEKLVTEDERISFLLEAKEKARTDRLRLDQIPTDFDEFSKFQLERLVKRNAVTVELEKVKCEKMKQFTRIESTGNETVIVDPYFEGHVLRKVDPEKPIVKKSDPDEKKRNWDKFLKKMEEEYDEDESDCGTGGFNYMKLLRRFAKREEADKFDDEQDEGSSKEGKDEPNGGQEENAQGPSKHPYEEMGMETIDPGEFTPEEEMDPEELQYEAESSSNSSDDDFVDVTEGFNQEENEADASLGGVIKRVREANPSQNVVVTPRKVVNDDLKGLGGDLMTLENRIEKGVEKEDSPMFLERDVLKRKVEDEADWIPEDVLNSELGIERPNLSAMPETDSRIDDGVFKDCQMLLSYLGLPFIVAPTEAEAQCVCLERLGLCDGIVTEDSDVWLFGGETVYRNMFGRKKDAMEFSASKIFDEFGISRAEFISIGMLAGGDYTKGFDGVGAVTALELCAEFEPDPKKEQFFEQGLDRLEKIGTWLKAKKKFEKTNPDKVFKETATKIRLRRVIESKNEEDRINEFPNLHIYAAYARPDVDSNPASFKWNPIDFDSLHSLVWAKMGWSESELKKRTHSALEIWQKFVSQRIQHYQLRMDSFLRKSTENLFNDRPLANTKRVQKALDRLRGRRGKRKSNNGEESSDSDDPNRLQTLIDRAKKSKSSKKQPHFTSTVMKNLESMKKPEVVDDFYDDSILDGFEFPKVTDAPGASKGSKSSSNVEKKDVRRSGRKKTLPVYEGPNLSEESESE
ncbi:unnamed protein product [Bursaphelenchus xylophilus]|uniref:(pine wood nematode) hypothetical protein n=1 Tax=Bursaphelenchus xylophilus TaxID=6326 RepID=A0A1I7RKP0_BURXY|nr:unnamed protein product [Bursaphelenchus xylophilus]CAG9131191.1 unnamed protein product [Bursaphelenchus xylophilus]